MKTNNLSYFFLSYLVFFFAFSLYYFLSYVSTFTSLPTPSFFLLTPTTYYLRYAILWFAPAIFLIALYVMTGRKLILSGGILYLIFLVSFVILKFEFLLIISAIAAIYMMITVLTVLKNNISKVLWGLSAFYFVTFLVSPLSINIILLSVIASAIEILTRKENEGVNPLETQPSSSSFPTS